MNISQSTPFGSIVQSGGTTTFKENTPNTQGQTAPVDPVQTQPPPKVEPVEKSAESSAPEDSKSLSVYV